MMSQVCLFSIESIFREFFLVPETLISAETDECFITADR